MKENKPQGITFAKWYSGFLYNSLWKRNLITKVLYVLIPFVLILIFATILLHRNAFVMEEGYAFLSDYTNCYMLCYIFFFVYFVHGLFLPYFKRQIETLTAQYEKKIRIAEIVICIVAIVASAVGIYLIWVANNVGFVTWQNKLNSAELVYYAFLIVLAWTMSFRLFATILTFAAAVYAAPQQQLENLDLYNPDKKCGLKGLFGALSASMGFGFYFLIAVAMILYSDYHAFHVYGIELGAYTWRWIIIGVTIVLTVVYYAILLIVYIELNKKMKTAVSEKLKEDELLPDRKSDLLRNISATSVVSVNDVLVFFLSVLFPGMTAVVQLISPFT